MLAAAGADELVQRVVGEAALGCNHRVLEEERLLRGVVDGDNVANRVVDVIQPLQCLRRRVGVRRHRRNRNEALAEPVVRVARHEPIAVAREAPAA